MDVRVRIVNEHARLDVARRVDVKVAPSARDASPDVLAVVLEVEREQRLLLAHAADEPIEALALLGVGISDVGASTPTGMYVKIHANKAPLSTSQSKYSSLAMDAAFSLV